MKNFILAIATATLATGTIQTTKAEPVSDIGGIFYPIQPCRLVDTRIGEDGPIGNGDVRHYFAWPEDFNLSFYGGNPNGCGIPATASAIHVTMTAVAPAAGGYLRVWPGIFGRSEPGATVFAWNPGFGTSNTATIPICSESVASECINHFYLRSYGAPTDLVIDAYGYYQPLEVTQAP